MENEIVQDTALDSENTEPSNVTENLSAGENVEDSPLADPAQIDSDSALTNEPPCDAANDTTAEFLTTRQVAELLGLSVNAVQMRHKHGTFKFDKKDGNKVYYLKSRVLAYKASLDKKQSAAVQGNLFFAEPFKQGAAANEPCNGELDSADENNVEDTAAGTFLDSDISVSSNALPAVINAENNPPADPTQNDNGNAELDSITNQIHFCLNNSALEIGKLLIRAKELVARGHWQNWLQDNFNMSYSTATRLMKTAERFSNLATSQHFEHLGQSHCFELLSLPDGDEENFFAEMQAAGTPIDEMSVANLRAEIKRWKQRAAESEKSQNYLTAKVASLENELANKPLQESVTIEIEKIVQPADYEYLKSENVELTNQLAEIKGNRALQYEIALNLIRQFADFAKTINGIDAEIFSAACKHFDESLADNLKIDISDISRKLSAQ